MSIMTARLRDENGKAMRRASLAAFAAAMLWGCAPNGGEVSNTPPSDPQPELRRVIVEFSLPEETAGQAVAPSPATDTAQERTAAREVAERIVSRLGPRARQSARTFELLPMVALDVDAATMMLLLRMPEVVSIQPDREVPMPAPSEGMMVPSVPPGHDTE